MHEANDSNLSFLARYGVEGICASATITDPQADLRDSGRD